MQTREQILANKNKDDNFCQFKFYRHAYIYLRRFKSPKGAQRILQKVMQILMWKFSMNKVECTMCTQSKSSSSVAEWFNTKKS